MPHLATGLSGSRLSHDVTRVDSHRLRVLSHGGALPGTMAGSLYRPTSKPIGKSKRFNGYKQHIATDLNTALILACAVTPANRPEEEAAPKLKADLDAQGAKLGRLVFVGSHAVHHYATIGQIAWLQGLRLEATFGIAPATATHRRDATCAR